MQTRRVIEKERGDEIKNLQKTFFRTQNTVYRKTKPNSLLKTEIKTRNSSVFSERLLHGEWRIEKGEREIDKKERQRNREAEIERRAPPRSPAITVRAPSVFPTIQR